MKQRILKLLLCVVLVLSLAIVPMTAQASNAAYLLKVTNDYARMRDAPTKSGNVVATLRTGTKVLYLGDGASQQCKVCTLDGKIGYVYRGYLKVYGAYNKNRIGYNTAAASLYVRNGEKLSYVATLPAGQLVLLRQVNGDWAYVKLINGKTCYMKTDTLKKMF